MFNNIGFIVWKKTDKYYCLANNCGIKNGSKLSSYIKHRVYEQSYIQILKDSKDQVINNKIMNNFIILKYIPDDIIIELNIQMSANVQLLSSISHKIRNPLTNIIGILTSIDKSKLTQVQKEHISILRKSSYEIIGVLNDIIDLVDFFHGELSLNLEKVDLLDLLNQCHNIVANDMKSKKLSLKIDIDDSVSKYIITDPRKLKQIIINMLVNAVQHLNIGGIFINVVIFNEDKNYGCPFKYVKSKESKKNNILFSIMDTGSGMDASKKNLVNSILGINNNNNLNISGIYGYGGLGLILSKFICNLMGGNIWFKTNDCMGTTFYFNIIY